MALKRLICPYLMFGVLRNPLCALVPPRLPAPVQLARPGNLNFEPPIPTPELHRPNNPSAHARNQRRHRGSRPTPSFGSARHRVSFPDVVLLLDSVLTSYRRHFFLPPRDSIHALFRRPPTRTLLCRTIHYLPRRASSAPPLAVAVLSGVASEEGKPHLTASTSTFASPDSRARLGRRRSKFRFFRRPGVALFLKPSTLQQTNIESSRWTINKLEPV